MPLSYAAEPLQHAGSVAGVSWTDGGLWWGSCLCCLQSLCTVRVCVYVCVWVCVSVSAVYDNYDDDHRGFHCSVTSVMCTYNRVQICPDSHWNHCTNSPTPPSPLSPLHFVQWWFFCSEITKHSWQLMLRNCNFALIFESHWFVRRHRINCTVVCYNFTSICVRFLCCAKSVYNASERYQSTNNGNKL